jgi:hypothetical protein
MCTGTEEIAVTNSVGRLQLLGVEDGREAVALPHAVMTGVK